MKYWDDFLIERFNVMDVYYMFCKGPFNAYITAYAEEGYVNACIAEIG